jgi:hypothetical protein
MTTRSRLACFGAAVDVLDKHPNTLLEDIGTYLVTDPALEPLRRLLRFGGGTFSEFLVSLEELPDRARLAMPDTRMPEITLEAEGGGRFTIAARWPVPGIAPLLLGALRAMADDYGALVFMELAGIENGTERAAHRDFRCRFQRGQGVLPRAGGGMNAPVAQDAGWRGGGDARPVLADASALSPRQDDPPRRADAVQDGRARSACRAVRPMT